MLYDDGGDAGGVDVYDVVEEVEAERIEEDVERELRW